MALKDSPAYGPRCIYLLWLKKSHNSFCNASKYPPNVDRRLSYGRLDAKKQPFQRYVKLLRRPLDNLSTCNKHEIDNVRQNFAEIDGDSRMFMVLAERAYNLYNSFFSECMFIIERYIFRYGIYGRSPYTFF